MMKKIVCVSDVLCKEDQDRFYDMLIKDWPQVWDAWIQNTKTIEKLNDLIDVINSCVEIENHGDKK